MTIEKRFEQALGSLDPIDALRDLVSQMSREGHDKSAILEIFEQERQRLRSANREAEEDAVMDVMDFLVGWCSPHMHLLANEQKAAPVHEGLRKRSLLSRPSNPPV